MTTTGSALVVEVDGRVLRLEGRDLYRIGRAIEADVVLTAGSVSRRHAELRHTDAGWVLADAGSQFGTWVDDVRIDALPVDRRLRVRCGPPSDGATLVVVPAALYADGDPAGHGAPAPPPADLDDTQVLALVAGPDGAGARSGPDLLIVAEGREHRFRHPATITIGRRPDCTVVLADPAASRLHGRIEAAPGAWAYTNASDEGTFLDGRRIATRTFDDVTELRLGHPVAGPGLRLVPILSAAEEERRIAHRRWRHRLAVGGGVVALVLFVTAVAGGAWLATRDDAGSPGTGGSATRAPSQTVLTIAELDRAKAATVKITATSRLLDVPTQSSTYHGSGSIIRADGLILTNAHVAQPEAEGLEGQYSGERLADPEYLLISLTDGFTDTNAPPAYRARVVEADGALDAAVLQIYAAADGSELEGELDLPTVPVGTSAGLRAGDDVTVLGFPAVAGSGESITVTRGVISTVLNDPVLGPRSELDTDARIAPGNSGGLAIDNDGWLIGIPTALFSDASSSVTSGRIRSIDVVKDLIERVEDAVD